MVAAHTCSLGRMRAPSLTPPQPFLRDILMRALGDMHTSSPVIRGRLFQNAHCTESMGHLEQGLAHARQGTGLADGLKQISGEIGKPGAPVAEEEIADTGCKVCKMQVMVAPSLQDAGE